MRRSFAYCLLFTMLGCGNDSGSAAPDSGTTQPDSVPPQGNCPDFNPAGNLYWGDLHSHTSYSLDSYAIANRNDPKDAYAFAKGTPVSIASGAGGTAQATQIDRPLDFLAVTDHSEFLNVTGECLLGATARVDDPYCTAYRNQGSPAQKVIVEQAGIQLTRLFPDLPLLCQGTSAREDDCVTGARTAWQKERQAAAAAYEPCRFTSLVAYEWTAQTGTANLHRNVIFANDNVPDVPLDYLHYPDAMSLWTALDAQCQASAGCDAITIPHNSNASYGQMWDSASNPLALSYMERYQILTEIFQHKGNSECLPGDALSDPKCNFEIVPGSFLGPLLGVGGGMVGDGGPQGYVRPGLARGLAMAATVGRNPLVLGIVGATDTHNGTPGNVKEQGWPGHLGTKDDTAAARLGDNNSKFNPGGVTGVWAPQNTREEIFAALKRRETYATSGPRIALRFYAASGIPDDAAAQAMCDDPLFPQRLLDAGAHPMGARMHAATGKPYLFLYALKDDAPLAEMDVVKLSSDAAGTSRLQIKSFPLSGPAQARACVFWSDASYDASQPTLYYARVFETPTPRWSHYDCASAPGTQGCDANGLDVRIQERAWSSPIFLEP